MIFLKIMGFIVMLFLAGCDSLINKKDYSYDDELIDQIRNAENKLEIEYNQLPLESISLIEEDYSSNTSISEMHAPELGYEITLNKLDSEENSFYQIYFDLNGKKLESKYEKNDEKCFDFIYPITFTMSDGTSIVVSGNNEEGWQELKDWYDNNSDLESKEYNLEYPVEVILDIDNSIIVINNEEEMIDLKEECYDK